MKKVYIAITIFFVLRASGQTVIRFTDGGYRINRDIYGHFIEHIGNGVYGGLMQGKVINTKVMAALKCIKVPVIRWPGGCFADQYHWRDGVGPIANRPKTVNTTWGMVSESNHFGTQEYLRLCEEIGCEPYIAGNVGTGTPKEMKDWIEYLNYDGQSTLADLRKTNGHAKPYHVSYWGVGNESWGCGGLMTAETYATQYRQYALFCKSYPGSPLKRIAGGANADDYTWTETLMKNIPLWEMWGLSFHYYSRDDESNKPHSATNFKEDDYFYFVKKALHIEELINKHGAIMDKYDSAHKVAMVIDEWGVWTYAEPGTNPKFLYQQNSLRDALIAASTLNIFNNHCDRIKMANLAQTVNVLQALIFTKGDSLLLTPTYHVFDLYKVHQDARLLPMTIETPYYHYGNDSIPAVNVSASVDSNNVVHISLVNLDPHEALAVHTKFNMPLSDTINGMIITSNSFTDVNTFNQPYKVTSHDFKDYEKTADGLDIMLPGKSVVVLTIKGAYK